MSQPNKPLSVICRDWDKEAVLARAAKTEAYFRVTGDHDLSVLEFTGN